MDTPTTDALIRLIYLSPRSTLMNSTFDELSHLFATDPVAAEIKAKELIDDYIETLDTEKQQRARAFSWRIQQELRNYKDPQARLNKMIEMFWAGVKDFKNVLEYPSEVLDQRGEPSSVIKFPKNTTD